MAVGPLCVCVCVCTRVCLPMYVWCVGGCVHVFPLQRRRVNEQARKMGEGRTEGGQREGEI